MSTSDDAERPLTRRRLRELRMTGQLPVIAQEDAEANAEATKAAAQEQDAAATGAAGESGQPAGGEGADTGVEVFDELSGDQDPARGTETVEAEVVDGDGDPEPRDDDAVDADVVDTAGHVIDPPAGEHPEPEGGDDAVADAQSAAAAERDGGDDAVAEAADGSDDTADAAGPLTRRQLRERAKQRRNAFGMPLKKKQAQDDAQEPAAQPDADVEEPGAGSPADAGPSESEGAAEDAATAERQQDRPKLLLHPDFGSTVRAEDEAIAKASFDEVLSGAADTSGTATSPTTLILSQLPGHDGPATGEIIRTMSHELPKGLGSHGHAIGSADGKEADEVLLDGEIEAAASPTPVAASSAVSTSKAPGEVIKPPAPEKAGRLMLILAITAGALVVALIVALIVLWVSGGFS